MKKLSVAFVLIISSTIFSQTEEDQKIIGYTSAEEFLEYCEFTINLQKTFIANNHVDSVLFEMNMHRNNNGVNPLTLDSTLCKVAELQSVHNARYDIVTHINKQEDIKTLFLRASRFQVNNIYAEIATENHLNSVWIDKLTVSELIINNFASSVSHNNIMIDSKVTKCGISITRSYTEPNKFYTIIVFAR